MFRKNNIANGHVSKIIENLNNNIKDLEYAKIKVLEPSDNEEIYLSDLRRYNILKEDIKTMLLELVFINKEMFFGTLTSFIALKFKEYNRIINMK